MGQETRVKDDEIVQPKFPFSREDCYGRETVLPGG